MADTTSTNQLQATITSIDGSGNAFLNRVLGVLSFTGVASGIVRLKIPNADTTITLPVSPTKQVYVKNNDSASLLTVKWTPNGGASNTVIVLSPGGVLILWDIAGVGNGITDLKLNQSVANTEAEYFLGG